MNVFVSQVACMQFINIVVHSVEDMNFRVHLQYEFTKLGLDDFLEVFSQCSKYSKIIQCLNGQVICLVCRCLFYLKYY